MIYKNNDSIIDIMKIQLRYAFLLSLVIVPFVLLDLIDGRLSKELNNVVIIVILLAFIIFLFTVYNSNKRSSKQFIEFTKDKLLIVNGGESEEVILSEILRCTIYNILGNKNLVIKQPKKTSGFLLNSYNDELLSVLAERLGKDKIGIASLSDIIKYSLSKGS